MRIGPVYTCSAWFGGKRLADPNIGLGWRMRRASSGAGALCDFGSHLIDLTDYVAGQRYREVSCMADTFIPMRRLDQQMAPVENDDAAAFLARGDHSIGNFCVSRTGMDDAMLLVTGVGGMVQLSLRGSEQVTYLEKHPDGGYTGKVTQYNPTAQSPTEGRFDRRTQACLDAIEGKAADVADIAQGAYVEEVLYAAQRASVTGNTEPVG